MERRIVLGGRAWVNGDVRTLSSAPITRVLGRALIVEPSSLVQSVLLELPDNSEPSALAKKPSCLRGSAPSRGVGVSERFRRSPVRPMPDAPFL